MSWQLKLMYSIHSGSRFFKICFLLQLFALLLFIESVLMFFVLKVRWALVWAFFIKIELASFNRGEIMKFYEPSYCAIDEYFNVNLLKCITCDSDKNLIPSPNGFSCVCNEKSKIKKWNFATFPICELCKENEIPTRDQMACISCPENADNTTNCENFSCPSRTIFVERTQNGSLFDNLICRKCELGFEPSSSQTFCVPCKQTIFTGKRIDCYCHEGYINVDGICVKDILKNWPDETSTFLIRYENGKEVDSKYFRQNLLRSLLFCKMGNQTSCHSVANMCSMVMYNDFKKNSPCSLFSDRKRITTLENDHFPWIYYDEGEAPTVLSRKRIPTQFSLDLNSPMSFLNLTGIYYTAEGNLKEIKRISGHTLQLCPGSWRSMDANFRFANEYTHSCQIPAKQLITSHETEFVDLFLRYKESGEEFLHAIPILILNVKKEGFFDNRENDRMQWQLVRRFYLLDKLSGFSYDEDSEIYEGKYPEIIRYAKTLTMNIKLQEKENEGKIFVPYLTVDYGEITKKEIENNEVIHLSFRVVYEMENSLSHALEVCMGIFSGLAVVWSGIQTWSRSKRSGRLTIDFGTVVQLIFFICGNLANVFFLVVFCACLNYFVFFKGQSIIHVLLPRRDQEEIIKLYLIFAFILKVFEMVQLIFNQITIDIFFIDWERPRARNLIPRLSGSNLKNSEINEEQPVSIWRTYFVANEWSEIQTKRKVNVNIHLLITVFILKVCGIEFWATSSPELFKSPDIELTEKKFSFTCQFAIGCLVYLITYSIQRIFMALIYERYIKNGIQEFVDMCSVANISVFILMFENYGFYIHGRSAHGFADTDMQNIINQLQREEEDLVGHRGLLPGTDQQTFEMTIPTQLRAYYRKVMAPLKNMSKKTTRITISTVSGRSKKESENVDKSIQAYHNMNRFLAAFLEHALKDLDFEVREKLFTESLLGIEFSEPCEKGVFYSDNGHSFDNVLFYGNEFALVTFDIILFSFMIAVAGDYLVAGIVTAALAYIIALIRDEGGRKNLAKKTLIDESSNR